MREAHLCTRSRRLHIVSANTNNVLFKVLYEDGVLRAAAKYRRMTHAGCFSLSLSVFSRLFQSRDIDDAKCLKQYIVNVSTKGTAAAYANTILSLFIWRSMTSSSNKSSRFSKALNLRVVVVLSSFVCEFPSVDPTPSSKSKSSESGNGCCCCSGGTFAS